MIVKDLPIEARLLEQLQAMPYDLDVNEDGHIVMSPRGWAGWTWDELCAKGIFSDDFKAWKIETDPRGQIILMSSPDINHQAYEAEIILLLARLLPNGRAVPECGVQTPGGTKEPDVIWISKERFRNSRGRLSLPHPPELCVEVISPSNTHREINEKRRFYFEGGAQEVWICGEDGELTFYTAPETTAPRSQLCPEFPARIDPFA